ncbi:uncharacterized protein LOC134189884 isoform X2 [Corticium candelabrum]|uniref:uncharacterized protein LOC134189884 isoform X2 n=1 Tax=Corticium candelabrum TaxID=121492 RepID=UPI002E256F61|nr:uncharacterized protein LOC134189884 isoform X2 [Corticium candelabrum]
MYAVGCSDLLHATRKVDGESGTLDCLVFHVDRLHCLLVAVDDVYNTSSSDVLEGVGMALSFLEELNHGRNESGYVSQILYENVRGRPRLEVKQDQLEYLLHLGFKCPKIGEVLGVSLSTIRRRMSEFGLSVSALYSFITDRELDELVSQIKCEFPNCGYRLLHGHLMSRGQRVSQARIRESLHRVDPEGVAVRWSSAIQRWKYAVLAPLSLWHLDGNHKLIRWRLVIHGGVDGYSRLPVYLHCSSDNCADTVLRLFQEGVTKYGLPSRIRIDKGGENVDVAMYLLMHPLRGPGRSTVIVGKSVHNQRIERMWRDVYEGVVYFYHSLFYHLESIGMLDPSNELDLFCLHFVYISRINSHLTSWQKAWIKHPMRSEHNLTPEQLWTMGLQRIATSNNHIASEVFEVFPGWRSAIWY